MPSSHEPTRAAERLAAARASSSPPARPRAAAAGSCLSVPIAAVLVVAGLLALRGGDDSADRAGARRRPTARTDDRRRRPSKAQVRRRQAARRRSRQGRPPRRRSHLLARAARRLGAHRSARRRDLRRRRRPTAAPTRPSGSPRTRSSTSRPSSPSRWPSSRPSPARPMIVERVPGPTAEDTIVRLAADAPAGQPTYEVTPARRRPLPLLPRDHRPARRLRRGRATASQLIAESFTPTPRRRDRVMAGRRRAVLLTLLALAAPLPAFAISDQALEPVSADPGPAALSVSASLDSCGVMSNEIVCKLDVSFNPLPNADSYTATITRADGSVTDYGDVGPGGASRLGPLRGRRQLQRQDHRLRRAEPAQRPRRPRPRDRHRRLELLALAPATATSRTRASRKRTSRARR